jgi:hypothetical protein
MRLLEFGKEVSLASVIEAIKAVPDTEVMLRIPHDTPWLKNPVNEKILRKSVQRFGKAVRFEGRPEPKVEPIRQPELQEVELVDEEDKTADPRLAEKDEAGFVVGADVMAAEIAEPKPQELPLVAEEPEEPKTESSFTTGKSGGRWDKIKALARWSKRRWYLAAPLAVLLLLGLGAYVVYAIPRADVKVVVEQRPLEREATLTASTTADKIDVSARIIPAKTQSATEPGSKKAVATGTKTVGTSAKGPVVVYNKTASNKTFAAGTRLTAAVSGKSYQYSLDTALTVPAASFSDTGSTYGQATSSVTATDIGPDYNISSATNLSIVGTADSDANAKSSSAFTGGSKKDVQVVSQSDLDKLLSDLTSQLGDKAKTDVQAQAGSNYQVIDKALKTVVTSKTYDHKAGDEASDVTLSLALSVTATIYSADDLKEMLTETLQQAVPDGYEASSDGVETSAELANVEASGDLTFTGRIKANLIPKFDQDQLKRDLAGKKPAAADSYLKDIPSVVSYQVNLWPNLPSFLQAFPRDPGRIHINVTVNQ